MQVRRQQRQPMPPLVEPQAAELQVAVVTGARPVHFAAERALVVLGQHRPLGFVALVQERQPEGQRRVAEDLDVLGPADDGSRRHQQAEVPRGEALARQFGQRHHRPQPRALPLAGQRRHARRDDGHLLLGRQVVERGDDVPAVDLRLVEPLGSVVQAVQVAQAHRVGGGEEAEARMRRQHPVLVQQREAPVALEQALDDEHHLRPAGVVLVEDQRHRPLQRPGQDALLELGHLLPLAQRDHVLAHQVEPAQVAVEVDADAGPVQARRHLLDMRGLAAAVQALQHDAPVAREAGQQRQRRVGLEAVHRIDLGHVIVPLREGRHLQIAVDAEGLAHANPARRQCQSWFRHGRILPDL